ncbi:carboxylesterase [Aliidiomarina sedimenti]|uniref:Carboxylesterase n=1 Tax=Aliidiomarina sedimenti TaxID=1933879 RepID=A0ABY0C024_9GAMM|nr:dienelactone hydrolase family protein [Aliidiomarina sedimenti]RUO30778.1 carboxylesterase [Aliidiomarina sedimenti]
MTYLPCEEVVSREPVNASVIWLHGLGADGNDFKPVVPHLAQPAGVNIRYVFPHAPRIAVTINNGMQMPAWYDILEMSLDRKVDNEQLCKSAEAVIALVEREIERGIPAERIILAGFSQGGAVAYQAALSYQKKLAGVMCLSTYLATRETIRLSAEQQTTPFLIHHGSMDPVVPQSLGEQARDWLQARDYQVEFKSYPMQHQLCAEQIADIRDWLTSRLA